MRLSSLILFTHISCIASHSGFRRPRGPALIHTEPPMKAQSRMKQCVAPNDTETKPRKYLLFSRQPFLNVHLYFVYICINMPF